MFETLVEAIKPYDFKVNNLCMFAGVVHYDGNFFDIVIEVKEGRQNLNFVLRLDETVGFHEEVHTHLKEDIAF